MARTATSGTVTGLVNGTTYTLQVRAVNAFGPGALSAASNAVTPKGLPGQTTAVVATRGFESAGVSWTAPAGDGGSPITGYEIQVRTGTTVVRTVTATGTATSTTVTGLPNGTAYDVRVRAQNALGSAIANWAAPAATGGSAITNYRVTAYRMDTDGVTPVGVPFVAVVGRTVRSRSFTLPAATFRFDVIATTRSVTASRRRCPRGSRRSLPRRQGRDSAGSFRRTPPIWSAQASMSAQSRWSPKDPPTARRSTLPAAPQWSRSITPAKFR